MRVHSLDAKSGRARFLKEYKNPYGTFLTRNKSGTRLYVGSEVNGGSGILTVYDITEPAVPVKLAELTESDQGAAYLALNETETVLVTCSYFSGTVKTYQLDENGIPKTLRACIQLQTTGPVGKGPSFGQKSPRSHGIAFVPDSDLVCISDYSGDRVLCYRLSENGDLATVSEFAGRPGDAVRHIVFHPVYRDILYVNTEYSGRIYVLRIDPGSGAFEELGEYRALKEEDAEMSASIHTSPDGKWLLSSNRTNGNISVFRITGNGTRLAFAPPLKETGCARDFIFTPDGRRLLVGDQTTDSILIYEWNAQRGPGRLLFRLTDEPTPATFVFAPF